MANIIKKAKQGKKGLTRDTLFEGAAIIAKYLRPHKKLLVILTVFCFIDAFAQAFVPLIAGKIFDALIVIAQHPVASLASFFAFICLWFLLQAADNVINWQTGAKNDKLSTIIQAEYTAGAFGRLLEMPLSFHVSKKQGEVSDRINRAAGWLDNIISNVLLTLLPNFLSIVIALFITLAINPRLTLVLLAAILIYSVILWKSVPSLSRLQAKMHQAYSRAYGDAHDSLQNIREIKQAATEKQEQRKIHEQFVSRAAEFWVDLNVVLKRLNVSQRILVTLTQLSIFVLSVFFVRDGTLTPGQLVAFNGYAAMMLGPFVILGQNWQTIQNGLVAIVQAEQILSLPVENYRPSGGVSPKKLGGAVAFEHVSFSYEKGNRILGDISFSAAPGEKIALVGESGMGKTTMIDLLCAFYFPATGKILIDGIDVKKMDLAAYRSRIGVVPQEPTLFNDTVENNIRYGNHGASREAMVAAAKEAHADEFIESFPKKYKQVVGWRGIKLSTGQKQRIALARAFLRNPDILILDEPTSALDARSEHLIKNSLRKLMAGRTTFIIAHRLSTVREADMILVLKDGKIVEQGRHHELVQKENGVYKTLYDFQTGFSA